MNVPQQIFTVFFAIFWGTIANSWPKKKPFHWPFFFYSGRVARRILWSFAILNVLPVLFFLFIFSKLNQFPSSNQPSPLIVAMGIIPAFSIFGLYRLWLAGVEFCPTVFYYEDEDKMEKEKKNDLKNGIDPTIKELGVNQNQKRWWVNGLFGLLYIAASVILLWFHN